MICWGDNADGTLGTDDPTAEPGPRTLPEIDDAIALAADDGSVCAVRDRGGLWCWGRGYGAPALQVDLRNATTWGSNAVTCSGSRCPSAVPPGSRVSVAGLPLFMR